MKKVFLITGGGHFPGIGSAIAVKLLETGNAVAVVSRSFDPEWNEYQNKFSDDLLLISADITNAEVQDQIIASTVSKWQRLDCLINNAAPTDRPVYHNDLLDRESWNLNHLLITVVAYELSLKCIPYLKQNQGSIINVGSRAGVQSGCGNNLAYSTSKAALHHLTKELALYHAPVRVNTIAPGLVITQRLSNVYTSNTSARLNQWLESSLLHQEITADDVADTAIYLIGAKNVTGQLINVCGGVTAQPPVVNIAPGLVAK